MNEERRIVSVDDLHNAFGEVLLLDDKYITRLMVYTVIANRLKLGPVWVIIKAPPSGGKSELLQTLFGLDCVYPLSSLTPNTLVSGMIGAGGKSLSLLDHINKMIVVMKDLTTIVEMNKDDFRAILGQLREVYDGRFDKSFGTGQNKHWVGHVGFIGAITPKGAEAFTAHGAMGERFVFYNLKQPDRELVVERSFENNAKDMGVLRAQMQADLHEYMAPRLAQVEHGVSSEVVKGALNNKEVRGKVFALANFATIARSAVELHWKTGDVIYVHPFEMPTRFTHQLVGLAVAAMYSHQFDSEEEREKLDNGLQKEDLDMLGHIAWSSIPPQRADIIDILAKYRQGTTKAVGTIQGLETAVVRRTLTELAALKVVRRDPASRGGLGDVWMMDEKWRKLVCEYKGFKMTDTDIGMDDFDEEEEADLSKYPSQEKAYDEQLASYERIAQDVNVNVGEAEDDFNNL